MRRTKTLFIPNKIAAYNLSIFHFSLAVQKQSSRLLVMNSHRLVDIVNCLWRACLLCTSSWVWLPAPRVASTSSNFWTGMLQAIQCWWLCFSRLLLFLGFMVSCLFQKSNSYDCIVIILNFFELGTHFINQSLLGIRLF
jgi:hypothetical protein